LVPFSRLRNSSLTRSRICPRGIPASTSSVRAVRSAAQFVLVVFGALLRFIARGHGGAQATFHDDQPFALQLPVSRGDGIKIDAQVRCHLAHSRQRLSFAKLSAGDEGFDAVGDLAIDSATVVDVDA
jgi:hypothetical protein